MDNLNNDNIIHEIYDDIEIIKFKKLMEFPELIHCYTLRKHNCNLDITKPENKENLKECYRKISKILKTNEENIVQPYQTHTDNIEIVEITKTSYKEVDGLITDKKDILFATTSADCISLLFYDPNKKVISNIHSGWRGTVKKIGKKAVKMMIDKYNSDPKDIICCICPSIRKCHFEVDSDVMEIFEKEFKYTGRIDEIIEKVNIIENKQKYYIDTVLINKIILEEIGLDKNNIIDSGICTVCNSDSFHSYRVDRNKSGRNAAFIGLI